jgi:hypothetical protein
VAWCLLSVWGELVDTDSAFLSVGFSLDVKPRSIVAAIVGA